jgi:hypothetical protein
MSLTQDELLVACGALAWCFTMKPKKCPSTGQDLPVPLDKSNSLLIIKPDPFQMAFEPRSESRKQEALRLWAESDAKDQRSRAEFLANARGEFLPVLEEQRVDEMESYDMTSEKGDKDTVVIEIRRVNSSCQVVA